MKIKVWKEKFTIVKSKQEMPYAFASIHDRKEITVIINENKIVVNSVIKSEKDFKLISFKEVLPFKLTGFIAKISKSLADEKIPIFVISSFSTDHILVKEKYIEKAVKCLERLK